MNQFSDYSEAELKQKRNLAPGFRELVALEQTDAASSKQEPVPFNNAAPGQSSPPDSVDWTTYSKQVLPNIIDQQKCNGDWAISTAETLTAAFTINRT